MKIIQVAHVVPGGGISDDGARWIESRADFFVPVKALSKIFRAKFRDEMARAGVLHQIDPTVWSEAFITDSRAVGNAELTLRYLSRYVFRVAISNARIVAEPARPTPPGSLNTGFELGSARSNPHLVRPHVVTHPERPFREAVRSR